VVKESQRQKPARKSLDKGNFMKGSRESTRSFRFFFVVGGFLFMLLVVFLARVVGDGPLVPLVFLTGWIVLVTALVLHFRSLKNPD
jgi:Na+/melibiose symporter-like transporter